MQIEEAGGHHQDVSHHLRPAQDPVEALDQVEEARVARVGPKVVEGRLVPLPGVLEGHNLGGAVVALALLEQEVVFAGRVERWIEVDQICRLGRDVVAQLLEVVPEEEGVLGWHGRPPGL